MDTKLLSNTKPSWFITLPSLKFGFSVTVVSCTSLVYLKISSLTFINMQIHAWTQNYTPPEIIIVYHHTTFAYLNLGFSDNGLIKISFLMQISSSIFMNMQIPELTRSKRLNKTIATTGCPRKSCATKKCPPLM